MKSIANFILKILGWEIINLDSFANINKGIFVVAPHNKGFKDFLLGLLLREVMDINVLYFGKEELFKKPFGFIFKALGGIPVTRSKTNNVVENYVNAIKSTEKGFFAIAPEGTRKNVGKLRTGFYYMAFGADIPMVLVGFDYENKELVFSEPIKPTGNFKDDMKTFLVPFFDQIGGNKKDWVGNYKNDIFEGN